MSTGIDRGLPGPARLEAFSDGVLAIAITLLVLEIKVPHLVAPDDAQEALAALVSLAPKFLGYLLIERVDGRLLWLNILLLLALSFIPFPTAMIGEYPSNPVSLALFAVVLMLAGSAFNLMWRQARARQLFHAGVAPVLVEGAAARGLIGPVAYGLAAIVAFLLPAAAWAIFIVVPLVYAFGSRTRSV